MAVKRKKRKEKEKEEEDTVIEVALAPAQTTEDPNDRAEEQESVVIGAGQADSQANRWHCALPSHFAIFLPLPFPLCLMPQWLRRVTVKVISLLLLHATKKRSFLRFLLVSLVGWCHTGNQYGVCVFVYVQVCVALRCTGRGRVPFCRPFWFGNYIIICICNQSFTVSYKVCPLMLVCVLQSCNAMLKKIGNKKKLSKDRIIQFLCCCVFELALVLYILFCRWQRNRQCVSCQ